MAPSKGTLAAIVGLLIVANTVAGAAEVANIPVKVLPGAVVESTDQFAVIADIEARFSSWTGSRGSNVFEPQRGNGSQLYTPFTIGFDYQKAGVYRFQMRAKSGYVHSTHGTKGQQASIDTMVDTQVTATWTNLAFESYRSFLAVALNLPTGKTVLEGSERFTRMDPDLVDVGSYGAGFNVNPTAGIIFALTENTAVSLGAGYSWQGSFRRETLNPDSVSCFNCIPQPTFDITEKIDPGDVFTANVNTSTIYGNFAVKTALAFMSETDLKVDNMPIGRKGAKYTANLSFSYRVDPRWTLAANGSWSYTEKDKIPRDFFVSGLMTEPKNSNSHVLIGSFDSVYAVTDRLTAGLNYSVLWRDENFYDFTEERFSPKKLKHSVGASLHYAVTAISSVGLRGSYFWVDVDNGPFLPTATVTVGPPFAINPAFMPPSLRYTGWTAALSGRVQF